MQQKKLHLKVLRAPEDSVADNITSCPSTSWESDCIVRLKASGSGTDAQEDIAHIDRMPASAAQNILERNIIFITGQFQKVIRRSSPPDYVLWPIKTSHYTQEHK